MSTKTETKRPRGRPRIGEKPMTVAERQAARRQRQEDMISELEKTVVAQRREIITLRKALDADETHKAVKAVIGEDDIATALMHIRQQLKWSLLLVNTTRVQTRKLLDDMYSFAISGQPMPKEKRKAVFKDIQAMQEAADVAHGWLVADPDNPPPWTRSMYLPWQLP
jgi:hypothetical protein